MFCIDENNSIRHDTGTVKADEAVFDSLTQLHDIAEYRKWSKQTVTDIWNGFAGTAGPFADMKPCKCFRNRPYGLQRIWEAIQRLVPADAVIEPEQSTTPILDEETKRDCPDCNGTGQVCELCGNADGDCLCEDGPELRDCDACDGDGQVEVTPVMEEVKEPASMNPNNAARKPKKKVAKVKTAKPAAKTAVKAKDKSNLAELIRLASRKNGVSVDEAMAATGWNSKHTVRGRLSQLGSKGMKIERSKHETRGTVYRVA